jgi:hypothetical protein
MGANVFAVQNTAGYVWRSKPWLPCADDVCRSLQQHYSNRVCASQGRSHKRSEVVVVTPYGCTRVCSSSSTPTYEPRIRQKPRTRLTPQRQWQTTSTSPVFLPTGTPSLVQNGNAVKDAVRRRSRRSGQRFEPEQLSTSIAYSCRFTSHPIQ